MCVKLGESDATSGMVGALNTATTGKTAEVLRANSSFRGCKRGRKIGSRGV
jgi:hypothetical protein